MELFLLYLWTRLDAAQGFLFACIVLCAVIIGHCLYLLLNDGENYRPQDIEEWRKLYKKLYEKRMAKFIALGIFVLALLMALPSKKDAAILVGGYYVLQAANSPIAGVLATRLQQEVLNYLQSSGVKK